eukprot:g15427.t1
MSSSQQQPVLLSWPSSDDFVEDDATDSDYYTSSVTEDVTEDVPEDEQKEPARSTASGEVDKVGLKEPHMVPPRSTARTLTPSRSTDFTITHDLEFDYASSTATSVGKTWSSGVASSSKNLRGTMTPSFLDDDATPRNKDD